MRTVPAPPIPTSNILSTRLSPGCISHLSNQASIPFSRSFVANPRTKRALSSLAWLTKTFGVLPSSRLIQILFYLSYGEIEFWFLAFRFLHSLSLLDCSNLCCL